MKECLVCRRVFDDRLERCERDRSPLKATFPGITLIADIYRIEERIGQGSLGVSYRAVNIKTNEDVAIKLLRSELVTLSPDVAKIFFEEAAANRRLSHNNLVKVRDYGQDDAGTLYLVTDYLAGYNLKTLIDQEPDLNFNRVINLTNQISSGLVALHERGRLHQELKPTNIFIIYDENGKEQVKLLDSGLARIKWQALAHLSANERARFADLPHYLSPEQLNGQPISLISEIYSMGVILYHMLAGRTPFQGTSYQEIAAQNINRVPNSPWAIRRDVPEELDMVVMMALAKPPESRVQSVKAFQAWLNIAQQPDAQDQAYNLQTATNLSLLAIPAVPNGFSYMRQVTTAVVEQQPEEEESFLPKNFRFPGQEENQPDTETTSEVVARPDSPTAPAEIAPAAQTQAPAQTPVQMPAQLPPQTPAQVPTQAPAQPAAAAVAAASEISSRQRTLITVGSMTAMFLAALEVTVVATAMPKVVAQLGGFATYSWVFSIYLLTSTVGMPIWGKLCDLYGRRLCYQLSISIFLIGSILCGLATSMNELICFRAIQGLGGGALAPLALIVVGDYYSLQDRPRMQAIISAVWGLSSILGPLVGGVLTDQYSWRWIFFFNIPIGLAAAGIISIYMNKHQSRNIKPKIDFAGAFTLTVAITMFLLGCLHGKAGLPAWFTLSAMGVAVIFLGLFIFVEKRAPEPLLPLYLFREKVFLATVLGNMLAGCALFGSMPFVTLFAQGVLNASATKAGTVLIPLVLGWVTLSVVGARLMLKAGFRKAVIVGMSGVSIGFGLLSFVALNASKIHLYVSMGIVGMGMGLALTALIIALQSSVPKTQLGVVTSAAIFFRNIGGSVGATVMGAVMSFGIARAMMSIPESVRNGSEGVELMRMLANINSVLDPANRINIAPTLLEYFRIILASGINKVFIFCFIIALCAFASVLLLPSESKKGEENKPKPA